MKSLPITNRIAIFIMSLAAWLLMTSFTDLQEIMAGIVVAFLVTLLSRVLLSSTKIHIGFKKICRLIIYFLILIWEMVKANFYMMSLILRPKLPVNSGIVKIKTGLKNDAALTILANSLTLTAGTLAIDVNQSEGLLYVHCIEIPGRDLAGNTAAIGEQFEKRLREIFE